MNDLLDNFNDDSIDKHRFFYFLMLTIFSIGSLTGAAYLQHNKIVQITPVFGTSLGIFISCSFVIISIYCFRRVLKSHWMLCSVVGFLSFLMNFTIAFQLVILNEPLNWNIIWSWFSIGLGYSLYYNIVLEVLFRIQAASRKKQIR